MKRISLSLCLGAFFIACFTAPASGIAPFGLRWRQKYLTDNKNEEFVKAAKAAKRAKVAKTRVSSKKAKPTKPKFAPKKAAKKKGAKKLAPKKKATLPKGRKK